MSKGGIKATLVGGVRVSIYTNNKYVSGDLDFVTISRIKEITPILNALGFQKKSTRHFEHPQCEFFVEFVSPPLCIGKEPVKKINQLKTKSGTIKLLTPTDCIKDRLAAYFFWDDLQSLKQAILVAKRNRVNFSNIRRWAKNENNEDRFKIFLKELNSRKGATRSEFSGS